MPKISIIIAAAGSSSRFQNHEDKKPFIKLGPKAVWLHSADLFLKRSDVKQIIVVVAPEDKQEFQVRFGPNIAVLGIDVVAGGKERSDSVANALEAVSESSDLVLIHDAARPCIDAKLIDAVVDGAIEHGAAIPAIPVNSTLKRSSDGKTIDQTVDRTNLYLAQTPQGFNRTLIQQAYAQRTDQSPTDEAQLLESQGHTVALVPGSPLNIKITHRGDLKLARTFLDAMPKAKPSIFD